MNAFRHYSILWISFILLFSAAMFGLEIVEGNKITTTLYYGLSNMGSIFIAMICLTAALIYPVSLLPLSMLIRKVVAAPLGRVFIYSFLGVLAGIWAFDSSFDDDFVRGYDLNISSAVILFGTAGLVYALVDNYLGAKTD